jgi:hypothetical protein
MIISYCGTLQYKILKELAADKAYRNKLEVSSGVFFLVTRRIKANKMKYTNSCPHKIHVL